MGIEIFSLVVLVALVALVAPVPNPYFPSNMKNF
jgi:hypothetical protein